jgi:hypothetical protein
MDEAQVDNAEFGHVRPNDHASEDEKWHDRKS